MTWEPSTRGCSPAHEFCHHGLCKNPSIELGFYILDFHGVRYFCDFHWNWVSSFINLVKDCPGCLRNHLADFYRDHRTKNDMKHLNKWWRLCSDHLEYLDDEMCMLLNFD